MKKPVDKLTAAQLADSLGVSIRTIDNMTAAGQIHSERINKRGDRRFSVLELLASETMPEEHKNSLLAWYQNHFQEKPASNNPENLPLPSNGNLPARIEGITKVSQFPIDFV